MLIKGYELNDELIVEIGKFAVLWNLFEKTYCHNNCSPAKIINISNDFSVNAEKQANLAKALNDRREWFYLACSDFIVGGLYSDNRPPKENEREYVEAFLEQETDSQCGCLLCVYRIRNNLMHGLKDVETLNNQLEIFKAANGVLEEL